jgi:hypothetical protein
VSSNKRLHQFLKYQVAMDMKEQDRRKTTVQPETERRSGQERRQLITDTGYLPVQVIINAGDHEFVITGASATITTETPITITIKGAYLAKNHDP